MTIQGKGNDHTTMISVYRQEIYQYTEQNQEQLTHNKGE